MSEPIDAFLNLLPGTLGEDNEIVAALDRLINAERAEARATQAAEIAALREALKNLIEALSTMPVHAANRPAAGYWDTLEKARALLTTTEGGEK